MQFELQGAPVRDEHRASSRTQSGLLLGLLAFSWGLLVDPRRCPKPIEPRRPSGTCAALRDRPQLPRGTGSPLTLGPALCWSRADEVIQEFQGKSRFVRKDFFLIITMLLGNSGRLGSSEAFLFFGILNARNTHHLLWKTQAQATTSKSDPVDHPSPATACVRTLVPEAATLQDMFRSGTLPPRVPHRKHRSHFER